MHCRRFLDGIIHIPATGAVPPYLMKMTFNKWAKLEAAAPSGLRTQWAARQAELRDLRISSAFRGIPMPYDIRRRLMGRRKSWKEAYARKGNDASRASSFMLECLNPQAGEIEISLVMRPKNDAGAIPYERRIVLLPGYNRYRVPTGEITARLDLTSPIVVQLIPNPQAAGRTLIFGLLDFVLERQQGAAQAEGPAKPAKQVKCVVWDLDNTLWRGIMIEDGADALLLNDAVIATVKQLDRRGILNSIVSKNNRDEALATLERFGIRDYFLFPQISWNPKSAGIEAIAGSLNIGIDSLAFIDDQEFERAEVASRHPSVRTYDIMELDTLLTRPEFDVPISEEAHRRRSFYLEEEKRATEQASHRGDYLGFLRACHLRLTLQPLTAAVLGRVHELTQRTNQMNFSGNRYDKETLNRIMGSCNHETFVMWCADRFGDYGTVGFAVLEKDPKLMLTDAARMFSAEVDVERALRLISEAARRRAWLVFFTHDVDERPSPWGCTPAYLEQLVKAAVELSCEVLTVRNALGFLVASQRGSPRRRGRTIRKLRGRCRGVRKIVFKCRCTPRSFKRYCNSPAR